MTSKPTILTLPIVEDIELAFRRIDTTLPVADRVERIRALHAARAAVPMEARHEVRHIWSTINPDSTRAERNAMDGFVLEYPDWHSRDGMEKVIATLYTIANLDAPALAAVVATAAAPKPALAAVK